MKKCWPYTICSWRKKEYLNNLFRELDILLSHFIKTCQENEEAMIVRSDKGHGKRNEWSYKDVEQATNWHLNITEDCKKMIAKLKVREMWVSEV